VRWKLYSALFGVVIVLLFLLYFSPIIFSNSSKSHKDDLPIGSHFLYTFNTPGTLYEAGSADLSSSPYWWLDSGGILIIEKGVGQTIQGNLNQDNYWAETYARTNPVDTDGGAHPQNIFRLVTKSMWHNFSQQAYFYINNYHLSNSPQRNESNGLLLFGRYENESNLYYLGVRVDGTAVIKKKLNGLYYTLAQTPIFPGAYDPNRSPNLLPLRKWIGLRAEVDTDRQDVVHLKLFTDIGKTGAWKKVLDTIDTGTGVAIIDTPAYAGIRTDFMDVSFDDYQNTELE
jgi:hypothetical protein